VKESLRSLAYYSAVYSGLTRLGRRLADHSGTIVLYGHRVSSDDEGYMQGLDPEWLDQQLAYLCSHFEIVPLQVLVDALRARRPAPTNSVVLTFDDGFRDNYEQAFPLLRKYGVTATVFAVTGSLTHGDLPWSQRLGFLFQHTFREEFQHTLTNHSLLPLGTAGQRKSAYRLVKPAVSRMPREQRDAAITSLAAALDVEPPRDRMMTWDMARDMQAAGIEIGAHTYSHPLLAQMDKREAEWEMRKSAQDLRRELGVEQPAFCFPAGSMNAALLQRVQDLGFRSCFLPGQAIRINRADTVGPYTMTRVGLPNASAVHLEAELDGPFHTLRRFAGRY